jgi:hypothetical protein
MISRIENKNIQLLAILMFITAWLLYMSTSAPGTIYGDPSEYQFIPAIWGIAHPPGYAFYTILAGIWQRIFTIGTIAFRTNLLAGAAAAWSVSRIVLVISTTLSKVTDITSKTTVIVSLIVGTAYTISTDIWQHAIHSNAHIVSVALTSTQLWLLVRWAETNLDSWLCTFAFFCGIGVTHHPITVWGLPAYAIYILARQPGILRQPKRLFLFIVSGLLGLAPLLYYIIRSPNAPFGPIDMRTWSGFVRHTTAQGLRVNLFHYGLQDQVQRWSVFISLLYLQYSIPFLLCLIIGCYITVKKRISEGILSLMFILGHLAFTLNSVQDVMAYLLHVFMALAVPIAVGCAFVLKWWRNRSSRLGYNLIVSAILLLLGIQLAGLFPVVSLRDWRDADETFFDLVNRFKGKANNAAYISDWEHLTPYYYHTMVEGSELNPEDLQPVYVTSGLSWDQAVFANLPKGPVYLTNYRREIRDLGFRLRPVGELWQVLEPPALDPVKPEFYIESAELRTGMDIIGYDLPKQVVKPGDVIPFTLYASTSVTQTDILMPYVSFASVEQRWTTDSRRLTTEWIPGEIIVEKYYIYIPHNFDNKVYSLDLHYVNMTKDNTPVLFTNGSSTLHLGELLVQKTAGTIDVNQVLDKSLTIIGNDISLVSVHARVGIHKRRGIWTEPLVLGKNRNLYLDLSWYALKRPEMSYTVFIHLIDENNVPHFGFDYTPLGGAFPTYLWFPKWLPGQQVNDPYKLSIPSDVTPGMYWLEVGMYEMGSIRRIPLLDTGGSMTGDRLILGPVQISSIDS